MRPKSSSIAYYRNFVFGVEDSLVSTVGLLSGVAIAGMGTAQIFATGLILIFVEAISMSAGSFLAESSADDYASQSEASTTKSKLAALVMFVSYFVSGFIPLTPYLIFTVGVALPVSIALSVAVLFALGIFGAKISKTPMLRSGMRMVCIGGLAIAAGSLIGHLVG